MRFNPCCIKSSSDLRSQYSEAQKAAAQAVKIFKEEFKEVWSSLRYQLFIGKQNILSAACVGKHQLPQSPSRTEIWKA